MKSFASTVLAACLLLSSLFSAEKVIIETDNITDIEKYRTSTTIIFFDLDDVVFTTSQYLGHSLWFYGLKEKLISQGLTWDQATTFLSDLNYELQQILPVKAVDERTANLIHEWQQTNRVLGLTSRKEDLSEATFKMLNEVGVDFASTHSLAIPIFAQYSNTSKIKNNVIFVSDYHSKGELVNFYLNKIDADTDRVIFIDDKEKYLREVMEELSEEIEFIGLRYSKEDERVAKFKEK